MRGILFSFVNREREFIYYVMEIGRADLPGEHGLT